MSISPEVQEAAKQSFINRLFKGKGDLINSVFIIKEQFNLSKERVQEAFKQVIVNYLSNGDIDFAINLKYHYTPSEEALTSPEVQEASQQAVINCLFNGSSQDIDFAIKIKDQFKISEEILSSSKIQKAVQRVVVDCLSRGDIEIVLKIKDKFKISDEILSSSEVQKAAQRAIINCLFKGDIYNTIKIKDKFNLSEKALISPEVQEAAKQGFINWLSCGNIDDAFKIKDKFNLSEETAQQAAKQGFINCLSDGNFDVAIEIKGRFNISISPAEIIEKIPKLGDLLDKIKEISPEFYEQTQKSTEILIELFNFKNKPEIFFKTIESNQYLLNAVAENPRFGAKLLVKYPQLDELSQQNIRFLFGAAKEISAENPEISPESLEFRQLMQEKLKGYENNSEILGAMEKNGVNINKWLDYSETKYFNLESGESHLAFSETISLPINRIKETIDSYAHAIKETLKEYRQELVDFKIPLENPQEIAERISQMQIELDKAKAEGNDKKARGIEKGLEGLQKKLENIKKFPLWDKLCGDISVFQQFKNDVFRAQENLIVAENELQEKLSAKMPSGKMIYGIKEKINKAKEELRSKFEILERRIDDFKSNLMGLISPCLGQERSEALIQEIEQKLAEQFDHYNADRSALANLFSGRSDKEKDKLENQPMSAFVWARNPNIDL